MSKDKIKDIDHKVEIKTNSKLEVDGISGGHISSSPLSKPAKPQVTEGKK